LDSAQENLNQISNHLNTYEESYAIFIFWLWHALGDELENILENWNKNWTLKLILNQMWKRINPIENRNYA